MTMNVQDSYLWHERSRSSTASQSHRAETATGGTVSRSNKCDTHRSNRLDPPDVEHDHNCRSSSHRGCDPSAAGDRSTYHHRRKNHTSDDPGTKIVLRRSSIDPPDLHDNPTDYGNSAIEQSLNARRKRTGNRSKSSGSFKGTELAKLHIPADFAEQNSAAASSETPNVKKRRTRKKEIKSSSNSSTTSKNDRAARKSINFNENVTIYSFASQVSPDNMSDNANDYSYQDEKADFDEDNFDENAVEEDVSYYELEQNSRKLVNVEDDRMKKPSLFSVSIATVFTLR